MEILRISLHFDCTIFALNFLEKIPFPWQVMLLHIIHLEPHARIGDDGPSNVIAYYTVWNRFSNLFTTV